MDPEELGSTAQSLRTGGEEIFCSAHHTLGGFRHAGMSLLDGHNFKKRILFVFLCMGK